MNYVVCFEVEPTEEGRARYLQVAAGLRTELDRYPGFISIERAADVANPRRLLSISFWRDAESIVEWRMHSGHREAQWLGRTELFRDYRLRIGRRVTDPAEAQLAIGPNGHTQYRSLTDPAKMIALSDRDFPADATMFAVERDYGKFQREQAPHPKNPIAAVTHADPYPYYRELAAHRPFYFDEELQMWIASSSGMIREVMASTMFSVRNPAGLPSPVHEEFARFNDPPRHAALRAETLAALPGQINVITNDHEEIGEYSMLVALQSMGDALGVQPLQRLDLNQKLPAPQLALLLQSYESTAALIGNTILAIGRAKLPIAAETVRTVLRTDPPIQNTRRYALRDTTIAGQTIRSGDTVLLVLAAAGLPFGFGPHECPGESLAVQIAFGGVEAWLRRNPPFVRCEYKESQNVRMPMRALA